MVGGTIPAVLLLSAIHPLSKAAAAALDNPLREAGHDA